jgi:Protein of unknown function (DUF551)
MLMNIWIDVKEMLPKKKGDYLVTIYDKNYKEPYIVYTAYFRIYDNGSTTFVLCSDCCDYSDLDIIAWMPLPEPYRKGE